MKFWNKKSTTILLYKNGDEAVPSNWRPISLQNAVYKIYAAIWGRRLATWAGETGAISPSQKGFVPGEGCLEHSFLVRSMVEDARRRHRPLHLVWFDLKNAFGSIPHDLLWHSMRRLGVPEEAVSILMDVYQGSTYTVRARNRRRHAARQGYDGPGRQRLFRRNRKRCVRGILEGENGHRCPVPADDLDAFYRRGSSGIEVEVESQPEWLRDGLETPPPNSEWEAVPISPGEVEAQLKRLPSASAPGPDRLPYKVWKVIDPEGVILTRIFEVCRQRQKIPAVWKESTTILIHKRGDDALPQNWRPIALQNVVYKIYAAILGRRLACWAGETGAISPVQKGFVPGEGCLEHSFLVRSVMEDARRRHRQLHVVWFDLRNAFGSVPHNLIWYSMWKLRAPDNLVSILMDIYDGSTFTIQSAEWATGAIPQQRGVKQGCHISPLLFNLAIEGLIRGVESSSATGYSFTEALEVKCLAYADDLAIVGATEEDVEVMLARLEEFSRWSHMDFNVAKCASLATTYQGEKRVVLQRQFHLGGQAIPVMAWENRYKHLGVLLGPNPDTCLDKLAADFRRDTQKVFESGLVDWMVDRVGGTGRAGRIVQPGSRVQLLDQAVPLPAVQRVSLGI